MPTVTMKNSFDELKNIDIDHEDEPSPKRRKRSANNSLFNSHIASLDTLKNYLKK